MLSKLRKWWKKQALRKQLENMGKALIRDAWEDVKRYVQEAEDREISGKEKFNMVLGRLRQKYSHRISDSIMRTAIQIAVELVIEDHLEDLAQ